MGDVVMVGAGNIVTIVVTGLVFVGDILKKV